MKLFDRIQLVKNPSLQNIMSSISRKSFSSETREASRPSTISGKSSSPITVHSYRGGNVISEIMNRREERSQTTAFECLTTCNREATICPLRAFPPVCNDSCFFPSELRLRSYEHGKFRKCCLLYGNLVPTTLITMEKSTYCGASRGT